MSQGSQGRNRDCSARSRPSESPAGRRSRRWLRVVALVIVATSVLLIAGGIIVRTSIEHAIRTQVAALSGVTGRTVRVGRIDVSLGRSVRVVLHDLEIAAQPGAARRGPLVHAGEVAISAAVWPAVRTRGRSIEVDSLAIQALRLEIVRDVNGALSGADVIARLRRTVTASGSARHDVHVSRAELHDASVSFVEVDPAGHSQTASVSHIDAAIPNLAKGIPLHLTADLAMFADAHNLHLDARIVPAATHESPDAIRLESLNLAWRHASFDAPLALHLARAAPIRTAMVDGSLRLDLRGADGTIAVRGELLANGVSLRDATTGAFPDHFDSWLLFDASVNPARGDYDVRRLAIAVDGMRIEARCDVRSMHDQPSLHALSVHATHVLLERVMALVPPRFQVANATLEGPVEITAGATGSPDDALLDARVDLSQTRLALHDIDKPAGAPASLEFRAHATPGRIDVERLGVVLGPLRLLSHGVVMWPSSIELNFDSGVVSLEQLLPYLPSARHEIAGRVSLRGNARIVGQLQRNHDGDHARLAFSLRSVSVRTRQFELDGDLDLHADGRLHRDHRMALRADLDATNARVVVPDRVDKPAGTALRARVDLHRTGTHLRIDSASLEAPGAHLEGNADADLASGHLEVHASTCDFDVQPLENAFPELAHRLPAALAESRARFALAFDGNPRLLRDATLHVTDLDFHAPYGSLHGRIDIEGLGAPRRIDLGLEVNTFDLGEIPSTGTVRPGAPSRERARPAWFSTVTVDATIRARELRRHDLVISNVDARVLFSEGRWSASALRFRWADGTVDLSGTQFEIDGAQRLSVHGHADHVDLAQIASSIESTRRVQGRMSLELDLAGPTHVPDVAQTLTGTIHATGSALRVQRIVTPVFALASPLLSHLTLRPHDAPAAEARPPLNIRSIEARLRLDAGVLRTTAPLVADSDLGAFEVTGSVGLAGVLDLRGTVHIPPETIRAQSNGRLSPAGPVPVTIHVTGATEEPRVEISDIGATLRALSGAGFRAFGERLRERFSHH